jgi:hypothetical protein
MLSLGMEANHAVLDFKLGARVITVNEDQNERPKVDWMDWKVKFNNPYNCTLNCKFSSCQEAHLPSLLCIICKPA